MMPSQQVCLDGSNRICEGGDRLLCLIKHGENPQSQTRPHVWPQWSQTGGEDTQMMQEVWQDGEVPEWWCAHGNVCSSGEGVDRAGV